MFSFREPLINGIRDSPWGFLHKIYAVDAWMMVNISNISVGVPPRRETDKIGLSVVQTSMAISGT